MSVYIFEIKLYFEFSGKQSLLSKNHLEKGCFTSSIFSDKCDFVVRIYFEINIDKERHCSDTF